MRGRRRWTWPGALLNADIVGQFLTLGGARAYLYGLEPNTPIREVDDCDTWGNLALFLSDDARGTSASPLATFYGARLLTQAWAQPGTTQPAGRLSRRLRPPQPCGASRWSRPTPCIGPTGSGR